VIGTVYGYLGVMLVRLWADLMGPRLRTKRSQVIALSVAITGVILICVLATFWWRSG